MPTNRKIAVVLKGYPRLSETFIAQELLGLERAGLDLVLIALRRPTDGKRHPVHDEIRADVHYLPEYLHEEPLRVLRGLVRCLPKPGFWPAFGLFLKDLRRDFSRNRFRRFGQALVLASEWPGNPRWLHAHFIHTPASVTAYASAMAVHEFKDGNDGITFNSGPFALHYDNQRIGTYGQGKLGFSITTPGGVTGFIEGTGDVSDHYKGVGGRAGIQLKF